MGIRRALVIGGGISGLAAAAALGRRGVEVDVVEIREQLGDAGGIGLSIMGNAILALDTIGAAAPTVAAGMPGAHVTVRSQSGDILAESAWPPLGKADWPPQVGISRADFHGILAGAAEAVGARIRCGLTASAIEQDAAGAHVSFTGGGRATYDLVIGADGAYSETRRRHFPGAPEPSHTGLAVWRAYAPRPAGLSTMQMHFDGPHGVVGVCPINEQDCYVYCIHRSTEGERQDPDRLHETLRAKLASYRGIVSALAAELTDPALVSYRPLEWLLLPAPWYRGRVVLIGDAAHTNPPTLAQGAGMGIEDGVVLAQEVTRPGGIEDALDRFMARRWERAKLVVEVSCSTAQDQAEHTPGFDAAAELARASAALCSPF